MFTDQYKNPHRLEGTTLKLCTQFHFVQCLVVMYLTLSTAIGVALSCQLTFYLFSFFLNRLCVVGFIARTQRREICEILEFFNLKFHPSVFRLENYLYRYINFTNLRYPCYVSLCRSVMRSPDQTVRDSALRCLRDLVLLA